MLLEVPCETLQKIIDKYILLAGFPTAAFLLPKVCRAFRSDERETSIFGKTEPVITLTFNESEITKREYAFEQRDLQWKESANDMLRGHKARTRSEKNTAMVAVQRLFNARWMEKYIEQGIRMMPSRAVFNFEKLEASYLFTKTGAKIFHLTDTQLQVLKLYIEFVVFRPKIFYQVIVKGFPPETNLFRDIFEKLICMNEGLSVQEQKRFSKTFLVHLEACNLRDADIPYLSMIPHFFPGLRVLYLRNLISNDYFNYRQLSELVETVSFMRIMILNLSNDYTHKLIQSKLVFSMDSFVRCFKKLSFLRVLNISGWPIGRKNWRTEEASFIDYLRENRRLIRLDITSSCLHVDFCFEICKAMNSPRLFERKEIEELHSFAPIWKCKCTFIFAPVLLRLESEWMHGQRIPLSSDFFIKFDSPIYNIFEEFLSFQYDSVTQRGIQFGFKILKVEGGIKLTDNG